MEDTIYKGMAISVIGQRKEHIRAHMDKDVADAICTLLDSVSSDILDLPSAQFATDINVGDTIYRQQVIDLINARLSQPCKNHTSEFVQGMEDGYCRIRSDIKWLPSAHQEPKQTENGFIGIIRHGKADDRTIGDLIKPIIEHPQWIPCSEKLPNEDEEVLVTSNNGIFIAELSKTRDKTIYWFETVEGKSLHNVTAWMPLPEPYRGDGE